MNKKIFFFNNLQLQFISSEMVALEINEVSHYNLDIKFLHFHQNRVIKELNEVHLKPKLGESIRVSIEFISQPESNKRLIKLHYDYPHFNKFTLVDISRASNSDISEIIYLFLEFCKNHIDEVRSFGIREYLSIDTIYLKHKKTDFLNQILRLKFYSLETSINRVGKDNVFTDHLIIKYEKHHNIYLIKLLSDYLVSSQHDKINMTFKTKGSSHSAWSPSFEDRITEIVNADNEKVKLIEFVYENFNVEEGIRMNMLNIEF